MRELKGELKDVRVLRQMAAVGGQLSQISDQEIYELERAATDETLTGKIAKSRVNELNEAISGLNSRVIATLGSYDEASKEITRGSEASRSLFQEWENKGPQIESLSRD